MIEGHPDSAPSQKWIGLFNREIRQRLVTANIQGAHCHRGGIKSLKLLPVELPLLLFTGKSIPEQKADFRAVKPDTLSTIFPRALHVGGNTRVHPQRHRAAIGRDGRLLRQRRQLLKQCFILGKQALEARQQINVRVDINPAIVTIDDQPLIRQLL